MKSRKFFDFDRMANKYEVGDVISFELIDGEKMNAMAMKETDNGMIFLSVDCLQNVRRMYERGHEINGYEHSDLRQWLVTDLINKFPAEIRDHMIPFENGDLLRIPTEKEVFGTNEYSREPEPDVEQWEPMKQRRNRIGFQGIEGDWQYWWLRDVVSAADFALVDGDGYALHYDASHAYGVRPAFKIKIFNL